MISPETIALVRERASIADLVDEVTPVRRQGAILKALCPFHNEKTPSFNIRPDRGFFKCFGCGESGDALAFVMKNEGLDFPDAVRSLAERLGISVEEGASPDRAAQDQKRREQEALFGINAVAAAFYFDRLWGRSPAAGAVYAMEELEQRGLVARPEDEDAAGRTLKAFQIGYAPSAWRGLVEHLARNKLSLPLAEKAGLLVQKAGRFYDRFRHRLMFPVLDHLGRVIGFSGRLLPEPDERYRDAPDFRLGEHPAKYTNTPETPIYSKGGSLFGLWQARDSVRAKGALLVEGNFDVVSLHAQGLTQALTPLGTAFTEPQARLLRRFTSAVTVAFDGDAAGAKATFAARLPLGAAGFDARVAVLPAKSDPDSFVRRHGAAALETLLGRASPLREHLFRRCFEGEEAGPQAQGARIQAALDLLSEQKDVQVQGMERLFIDALARHMVVDGQAPANLRDLELRVRRALRADPVAAPPPFSDPVSFAVLGAVLDVPSVLRRPEAEEVVGAIEGDLALAVAAAQEATVSAVLGKMPALYLPHAEARLAAPLHVTEEAALGALLANGRRLRVRQGRTEEAALRAALRTAEAAGDEDAIQRLLGELSAKVRERLR